MPSALDAATLPPLPGDKNLLQVLSDYIAYLMQCAKKFIIETHATISDSWDELNQSAVFIIGHPNGWEGAQQQQIRRAAVLGGVVPNTPEGRARVRFVSEGEASLHFCLSGDLLPLEKVRRYILSGKLRLVESSRAEQGIHYRRSWGRYIRLQRICVDEHASVSSSRSFRCSM